MDKTVYHDSLFQVGKNTKYDLGPRFYHLLIDQIFQLIGVLLQSVNI